MSVCQIQAGVSLKAKESVNPQDWPYRQLLAAMWVLGMSYEGTASALYHSTISPVSQIYF